MEKMALGAEPVRWSDPITHGVDGLGTYYWFQNFRTLTKIEIARVSVSSKAGKSASSGPKFFCYKVLFYELADSATAFIGTRSNCTGSSRAIG